MDAAGRRVEARILFVGPPMVDTSATLRAIARRLRPDQVGPLTLGGGPGDVEVFMLPVELGQVGRLAVALQLVAPVPGGTAADELEALVEESDGIAFVSSLDPVEFEGAVSLADQIDRLLGPRRIEGLPPPVVFLYTLGTTEVELPLDVVDASLNPLAAPRFVLQEGDERPLLQAVKEIAKTVVRHRRALGDVDAAGERPTGGPPSGEAPPASWADLAERPDAGPPGAPAAEDLPDWARGLGPTTGEILAAEARTTGASEDDEDSASTFVIVGADRPPVARPGVPPEIDGSAARVGPGLDVPAPDRGDGGWRAGEGPREPKGATESGIFRSWGMEPEPPDLDPESLDATESEEFDATLEAAIRDLLGDGSAGGRGAPGAPGVADLDGGLPSTDADPPPPVGPQQEEGFVLQFAETAAVEGEPEFALDLSGLFDVATDGDGVPPPEGDEDGFEDGTGSSGRGGAEEDLAFEVEAGGEGGGSGPAVQVTSREGTRLTHVGMAQQVSATAIEIPIGIEVEGGSRHLVLRVDVRAVAQPLLED